MSVINHPFM